MSNHAVVNGEISSGMTANISTKALKNVLKLNLVTFDFSYICLCHILILWTHQSMQTAPRKGCFNEAKHYCALEAKKEISGKKYTHSLNVTFQQCSAFNREYIELDIILKHLEQQLFLKQCKRVVNKNYHFP